MSNLLNINAEEILTLFRKHFPHLPEDMESSVNAILVTDPPQEVNAEVTLRLHELPGTEVAGVDDVLRRQQAFVCECRVDRLHHVTVRHRPGRGLHLGDDPRPPLVAGLAQMHLVADPARVALAGKAGIGIVG